MFFQLNCSCFFVLSLSLPPSIAGIVLCFSSNSATWRPTAHKSHQYCLFATVAALLSPTLCITHPVSLWLLLFGSYCCCFPSALSGTEISLPLPHLLTAQIAFCSTAVAASASASFSAPAAASACAVFIVALCVDLCALHVCVGVCGLQGVQATQVVLSSPSLSLSLADVASSSLTSQEKALSALRYRQRWQRRLRLRLRLVAHTNWF